MGSGVEEFRLEGGRRKDYGEPRVTSVLPPVAKDLKTRALPESLHSFLTRVSLKLRSSVCRPRRKKSLAIPHLFDTGAGPFGPMLLGSSVEERYLTDGRKTVLRYVI